MNRLTTNKEVSEMNMYELAHNSCYAKDGKARVRDFENDFDARELTIKLLEKYADIPNEFTCDEDFDEFMMDALQYGTDSILGLIAVFYRNFCAMADLRETLKHYEDLEEQGQLLRLPCRVGQKVYLLRKDIKSVVDGEITAINIYELVSTMRIFIINDNRYTDSSFDKIGEYVFFTQEEASAALEETKKGSAL